MDEEKIRLPIRSALIPAFYQNFHCLAQNCRDSCCVNWDITFDKKDYLRLRRLDAPPTLRERLKLGVRREKKGNHDDALYGKFDLQTNHGRCPFLDPDGLCAIQRICGHDALPHVCTTYPRHIVYSPAAKEYALSPSCEGVLWQLWNLTDGVDFVEDPLPKEERRVVNITLGKNLLLYFAPLRSLFIDILQNRVIPLTERMLYLGITVQWLQRADWDNFDLDSWVEQVSALTRPDMIKETTANIPGNRDMYLTQNLNVLGEITLEQSWSAAIFNALEVRRNLNVMIQKNDEAEKKNQLAVNFSRKAYVDALRQFQTAFSGHEYFFENLMVASALYLGFPRLDSKEALWKSYVSLCNLYSFYRFVSVLGCKGEATRERLFHMIAMASRATLHNQSRFDGFQEKLFQNDSSTLAHMAILLRWD